MITKVEKFVEDNDREPVDLTEINQPLTDEVTRKFENSKQALVKNYQPAKAKR